MTSPPVSPKPKRSVRGYIREQYDKLVRSHSRSPSQQSIDRETSGSAAGASTSPAPSQRPTTIGSFLAPPQLHRARSDSQLSTGHGQKAQTDTRSMIWTGLQSALEGLRKATTTFPPLELAIGSLISCLDLLETAAKNREEYEEIALELKNLVESLTRHMRESSSIRMSDCVVNVALGIEQQTKLIHQKQNRGTGRRLVEASADEEDVVKHYRKIESLFRQLQTDANLSTWSIANEVLANTRLEGLAPAKLANYDSKLSTEISRRTCTEGTRTAIMSEMDDWSLDPNAPDLYLMSGMAGTGKTTIACSFANRLEDRIQLAASFFCTRTSPECRDASRIVPTIAYQLARYSIPFQSALCEVLGRDPDIGSKNIVKQFERLLKEPLLKVKDAIPDNLVVVIDALDECDDRSGVRLMLDLLFRFAPSLPLRFFVTSRPEPEIYSKMVFRTPNSRTILHLHEIEKSLVQADIELYLKEELSTISPTEDEIVQLATRSGNLFIYAATLVRYIRPSAGSVDPQRRLQSALAIVPESTSKYAEIDALYAAVLKSALELNGLDPGEAEDVQAVLWTVLCAQEPISIAALATLSGVNDTRRTLSALQPLRSVVHLSEISGLASTLHASFPDFMFSKERSGPFFCDPIGHNQLLAQRCFEAMKGQLRFNICDLESSFVPDAEVEDLEGRISRAISPVLSYACQHWAGHLELGTNSSNLSVMLEAFLSTQLLFWIEVLNLRRQSNLGLRALVKAEQWLQTLVQSPNLARLARDSRSFLMSYVASPVSRFTPHIYISSLSLCPRSSSVYKHYRQRARGLIVLKGSGMDRRESAALATWVFTSPVRSIAYSSDRNCVAFGCKDGTIGVQNANDGSLIVSPFKGHSNIVWSVAFSPDGTRFASGSDDHTIKIWDTQYGGLIGGALQGHTKGVKSVAFSPDGRLIASGSADRTIRIWSGVDGTPVGEPFRGHTDWIRSVAFSPDSTLVVSGSTDYTIRIWNTRDGTPVLGPLKGHTAAVWSVKFSPDGARIASGSVDRTIRMWDARNGAPITLPFKGHTDEIYSIAFSPDGTRIASASRDNSIRIWGSQNGALVTGPFEHHTDAAWSVVYTSDGMRVISGSGDNTIRTWDAIAGTVASTPSNGHFDGLWSVVFSHDGIRIASGSSDSIYTWDSQSGALLSGPFDGHTDVIRSVAISADGKRLVSGSDDCTIRVWDIDKATTIAGPFKAGDRAIQSVEFSPNGAYIASSSADHTVRVQNSLDGKLVTSPFKGHTNVVRSIAFSPDGARIASGSYDRTVRVWNMHDGSPVSKPFQGHKDWVMSVAFSPCGKYVVSGSKDQTIRIWNTDGTLVVDPFNGHTDLVKSVAFSPNGACIISSSNDHTVRVWRSSNGESVATLYGHADAVTSAAISPDGTRIASGSFDCTIRIWDLSSLQGIPSRSESSQLQIPDPSTQSLARSDTPFGEWVVTDEGWITSQSGSVLFWAPREIIPCLMVPRCSAIIGRFGTIDVDLGSAFLGERWRECFV